MRMAYLLLPVIALAAGMASAAPRTWTSANGKFTIQAELVTVKDDKVELRKADGDTIEVPLRKLCEADWRYACASRARPDDGKLPAGLTTIKLELKQLPQSPTDARQQDFMNYWVNSQRFFIDLHDRAARFNFDRRAQEADFRRLVREEPAKYNSEHPLRIVAKLGGREYPLVIDAKDADSQQYDRLYFDRNRNGDLARGAPIDVPSSGQSVGRSASFSRVDLALDADGAKYDYSFRVNAYSRMAKGFAYASVQLSAAAYREGTIILDGKPRQIALLDFNSNGRFDDLAKFDSGRSEPRERIYCEPGDMLVLDPAQTNGIFSHDVTRSNNRHYLSTLANLDSHFFEVKVTPSGDTLTLTPLAAPMGKVATSFDQCAMVLNGERGIVSILAEKDHPALLPGGKWRLLAYTIRQAAIEPGVTEGANRVCYVSAAGSMNAPLLQVTSDATTTLPIGPPYRPEVRAQFRKGTGEVSLGMTLVGVGGEICTDMNVRGKRPGSPKLTITTTAGDVVERGFFKYG
jgi:hypothetical protein